MIKLNLKYIGSYKGERALSLFLDKDGMFFVSTSLIAYKEFFCKRLECRKANDKCTSNCLTNGHCYMFVLNVFPGILVGKTRFRYITDDMIERIASLGIGNRASFDMVLAEDIFSRAAKARIANLG